VAEVVVPDTGRGYQEAPDRKRGPGSRFTNEELALCLQLLAKKDVEGHPLTNAVIARVMHCQRQTVTSIRKAFADTTCAAAAKLKATALDAADDWVIARGIAAREGKHQAAKEQLEATGAIATQRQPGTGTTVVIVGVGVSPQTVGPDPWQGALDVTAIPVALPETPA
jgi:hypothetical protein